MQKGGVGVTRGTMGNVGLWDEPVELVDSQNCCPSCRVPGLEHRQRRRGTPTLASASGTPPSDTATTSGPPSAGRIGDPPHQVIKRIDLAHQMALAGSAV
jgi:hypothetical protein